LWHPSFAASQFFAEKMNIAKKEAEASESVFFILSFILR
jgi:hypothetical protein